MKQTEETRQFIGAILEEDGSASTAKIRRRTDLTEGQLQHQFRKLESHGFIEIDRTEMETRSGSRMKVAVITDEKRDEAESLLSHDRKPERTTVDVVELASELDELNQTIDELKKHMTSHLYNPMQANRERIEKLEEQISE
jgi:DNA-binding PadR family transcriptional regulator